MRLIDADALLVKQASIANTFARSDAQKSLIGRVMYNTERAPTIDAIPVEWMEGRLDRACTLGYEDAAQHYKFVLWAWEREKGAEDDG